MRHRFHYLLPVLYYLGAMFTVLGFLLLVPLVVLTIASRTGRPEVSPVCFVSPSACSLILGLLLRRVPRSSGLDGRGAMLVSALAWVLASAIAALPFCLGLGTGFLDAYFEAVSGFTTTGTTVLKGLDAMPASILFWRSFIQWIGGLGILAFFLAVIYTPADANTLFGAESNKILAPRPAPSVFHTLRILWGIYVVLTVLVGVALLLAGMSVLDAVCHSLSCLPTGGFSTHDQSIAYFAPLGDNRYHAIQYILIVGMLIGGTNFFIHYRVATGSIRALWDNQEMRLRWVILAAAAAFVTLDHLLGVPGDGLAETLRSSTFSVVAVSTTTGFATRDIGSSYFPALSKQIFLVLMVIGACIGSTGGGVKVMRVGILLAMVKRQMTRIVTGRLSADAVVVDRQTVALEEIRRVAAVFFAWLVLLVVGSAVTALLCPHLGPLEAASGMFSAASNVGVCYIPDHAVLHPLVKVTYIIGMLAGRLEILPILMLFSSRAWK